MADPYILREATNDDVGFILSSWLKSAGDAWQTLRTSDVTSWSRGVQVGWFADVPHRFTRAAVAEILERPTTRAVVACDVEDPSVIFGYAVGEPSERIVHMVYTKHTLRRNGLAHATLGSLLPDWRAGVRATYVGRGFLGWMSAKCPLRFEPHAGRR